MEKLALLTPPHLHIFVSGYVTFVSIIIIYIVVVVGQHFYRDVMSFSMPSGAHPEGEGGISPQGTASKRGQQ